MGGGVAADCGRGIQSARLSAAAAAAVTLEPADVTKGKQRRPDGRCQLPVGI